MKKISTVLFFSLVLTQVSCGLFDKKEVVEPLAEVVSNGLEIEGYQILLGDDQVLNHTLIYRENLTVSLSNVTGFTPVESDLSQDWKRYEERYYVVKSGGDTISSGYTGANLPKSDFNFSLSLDHPFKKNSDYVLYYRLRDVSSDKWVSLTYHFSVEPNLQIVTAPQGLSYMRVRVVDTADNRIKAQEIPAESAIFLLVEGVRGFEEKDGKVFPLVTYEVVDAYDNQVLYERNILEEFEETGIDPEKLAAHAIPIGIFLNTNDMTVKNPWQVNVIISDLNSTHRLDVSFKVDVKQRAPLPSESDE